MKKQVFNPYLPFWETIPDGEPHVFGDRLYVYGSHDLLRGTSFCEDDYVCWSAPVDDLSDWRYEGVIYKKSQDPINGAPYHKELPQVGPFPEGMVHTLFAPDVALGPDGRYYLFYALDFVNIISVAVCDTPAGAYEFLDYVTYEDGSRPEVGRWFDPAILCEESGNYLYYGFAPDAKFAGMKAVLPGSMMVKLADDMHTIITEPVCVANGVDTAAGTAYEAHPFFEASSIRHFGDWYYFVYSSLQGHELCYGMAKSPQGPFEYKGVLVSNGDLGYEGNTLATNHTGNNHGGLVQIGDKTYIFWHRHTHGTQFSRQGCADQVEILSDGTIPQIEITSCGLNGGPLRAKGTYQTYIACHLTEKDRDKVGMCVMSAPGQALPEIPQEWPYITEEECAHGDHGLMPYIHNMKEGAVAGFKYFMFDGSEKEICLKLRGQGRMEICLDSPDGRVIASAACDASQKTWQMIKTGMAQADGKHSLYFKVTGGCLDFAEFTISE